MKLVKRWFNTKPEWVEFNGEGRHGHYVNHGRGGEVNCHPVSFLWRDVLEGWEVWLPRLNFLSRSTEGFEMGWYYDDVVGGIVNRPLRDGGRDVEEVVRGEIEGGLAGRVFVAVREVEAGAELRFDYKMKNRP